MVTLLPFDALSSLGFCDAVVFSFSSKLSEFILSFFAAYAPRSYMSASPKTVSLALFSLRFQLLSSNE